jgi:hypothetical protein
MVFRNRGFEPFVVALQRRPQRPRLALKLPPPPKLLVRPKPPPPKEKEHPLNPLRRFFDYAAEREIPVVMLSPPARDETVFIEEIAALCRERGIPHLDYTDAPLQSHNSHLSVKGARVYSAKIAEDLGRLRERGFTPDP